MLKSLTLAATLTALPLAAFAMPTVGDTVGTNPTDATAALAEAGCMVDEFEAEDGKIEAKCKDADGKEWEVYIDPASGKVVKIEEDD
ncbi:PepSY domain-containing protein [Palleronia caenipelagi]|uniref:PepSY domain-containing protein n=1 Tax=Palleronia caenipelagi TaxID=2489174 RepID=A0A547PR69_9RHOB|nr:PepSY domain-containing protein [Palleronia caenipelagi]TRD16640.1 PepSY domain-containing protein [Palleronia caenipelagi]